MENGSDASPEALRAHAIFRNVLEDLDLIKLHAAAAVEMLGRTDITVPVRELAVLRRLERITHRALLGLKRLHELSSQGGGAHLGGGGPPPGSWSSCSPAPGSCQEESDLTGGP